MGRHVQFLGVKMGVVVVVESELGWWRLRQIRVRCVGEVLTLLFRPHLQWLMVEVVR
jgi:hypothetical protein